jgi:RNA polymerase sigma factor (sigma-70 family)
MEKKSDKELMQLIAKKNKEALRIIYRRYEIKIFNFILRHTGSRGVAQELIQETFTRIWFASHTFDHRRGNFKAWIYTIALNLTRNEMSKKEYSYKYVDSEHIDHVPGQHQLVESRSPNDNMEQNERHDSIIHALEKLRPYLREVIILKNFQQLKFREIAEATQLPESTLKARYHRAIELLKKELITEEDNLHV